MYDIRIKLYDYTFICNTGRSRVIFLVAVINLNGYSQGRVTLNPQYHELL